jgi:hypothetical protein
MFIRLTTRKALNAVKIYETIYIIDAINYIKSKSNKTKKDKESLYSLETVLKSM